MTAYQLIDKFKNGSEDEQESILRYILYFHQNLDLKFLNNLFQYNKLHISKWQRTIHTFIVDLYNTPKLQPASKIGKLNNNFFNYLFEIAPLNLCGEIYMFLYFFEANLDMDFYKKIFFKLFETKDFDDLYKKNDLYLEKLLYIFRKSLGEDFVKNILFIYKIGGNLYD